MRSVSRLLGIALLVVISAAIAFSPTALRHPLVSRGLLLGSVNRRTTTEDEWPGCDPRKEQPTIGNRKKVSHAQGSSYASPDVDALGFQTNSFRSGFVSILGNPNVGKSTLMNRLLRQDLCIMSPKPQTTRHRILGILTVDPAGKDESTGGQTTTQYDKDGYQLIFSDTPGMLEPAYKLQEVMQSTVRFCFGERYRPSLYIMLSLLTLYIR